VNRRFIDPGEFTYDLPADRIALHPLPERDESRLLVYNKGKISHSTFSQLPDFLPDKSHLFLNNTRVIPARLAFEKTTGAGIEVFLLQPLSPSEIFAQALAATSTCIWKCAIGNLKRWTAGLVLSKQLEGTTLTASIVDPELGWIKFTWMPAHCSFAEILSLAGQIPLPPYIKREPVPQDRERYQTVYSSFDGAVAAPTAGLHFSEHVLSRLRSNGIEMDFLTLHVSAGTFLPIKASNATEHFMHSEQIIVSKTTLDALAKSNKNIAVGTTAMRTLESLYWFAVMLRREPSAVFTVDQTTPHILEHEQMPGRGEAIEIILAYMSKKKIDQLTGETSIYIYPGYKFQMSDGLITNFHQPGSTLLLLIAAFVGGEWKKIYGEALKNGYRFLSYGDSSLLLPN
jgi:S-adenosylmethionine:tRNA ribosyltransferase-isomerase